jgi:hypothetical protein
MIAYYLRMDADKRKYAERPVVDAMYNGELAGPGVPAHHCADADIRVLATDYSAGVPTEMAPREPRA